MVGVLEIDEADEDDEEEAATPAVAKAKPAGKDAPPDKPGESEDGVRVVRIASSPKSRTSSARYPG